MSSLRLLKTLSAPKTIFCGVSSSALPRGLRASSKRTEAKTRMLHTSALSDATGVAIDSSATCTRSGVSLCHSPLMLRPRLFSSYDHGDPSYHKNKRKKKKKTPFDTLGVSEESQYADVKKAFLLIAMKHHPDTASSEEDADASRDIFIVARQAFESLAEGSDGLAVLSSTSSMNDDDLDEWFKEETGYDMPFMDVATMKEVADMTDTVGGGLDRDGGMWTLARMVTESVKSGGNAQDILKLEAGTVRDRAINGVLRRKRKRS